jgi:hypothetical protein
LFSFTSKVLVSVGSRRTARLRTDASLPSSQRRPGSPMRASFRHPTVVLPPAEPHGAVNSTDDYSGTEIG